MTPDQRVDVVVVGSVNIDLVASVTRLPLPGETVHASGYEQFVGGKGGNQAVAAARLGRRVAFVGLTGSDPEGGIARDALQAQSVDVTHLGRDVRATGRAIVLVDQAAENSIVVVGGANGALSADHVRAARDVVEGAAVVLAQLEVPVPALVEAARLTSGTFVLNAAPAAAVPRDLLDLVDVLVVNETEYAVVLGSAVPAQPADLARHVATAGLRCAVVVTLGARGALLCHQGSVVEVPAPAVPVVDTTGAGDTFAGALADSLSRAAGLPDAVRWAVHAASLSVGALGATTGMPTHDQVLASSAASRENRARTEKSPTREGSREESGNVAS